MRILLHDYGGHPFTAELARELARRGHEIVYAYFAVDPGPKGRLSRTASDPPTLRFRPVRISGTYSKSNLFKRVLGDIRYGRSVSKILEEFEFDIVISGNTPTDAQGTLLGAARAHKIPFVFWCQDIHSIAISELLRESLRGLGGMVGSWYLRLERQQMQQSSHVVLIADEFRKQTEHWGLEKEKVSIIPNWGTIGEIDVQSRDTQWSRDQRLTEGARFIYSGTLARKHNPELLADLSRALPPGQEVVVVSSGVAAEGLAAEVRDGSLPNLRPLPLQPIDLHADVLASADVLLGVIKREASTFSVPSKILSYLCAGRPIVLAAPADNLAAQIITEAGAGLVVEPEDRKGFIQAAFCFRDNPEFAASAGRAGRAYAERNFRLEVVGKRFENLFKTVIATEHGRVRIPVLNGNFHAGGSKEQAAARLGRAVNGP